MRNYILIIFLVIIDQFTKFLAVTWLKGSGTFPLIKGVLHLTYAENTGAAFSMFRGNQFFLIGVTSLVILALLYVLVKIRVTPGENWMRFCIVLITAGGLGNLIDRVKLHYVVDFIDFRLINFAIFNGADSFVSVGTALLFYTVLFNKTKLVK